MNWRPSLLFLLALLPACRGTGDRSAPQRPLEKGLFFEERDDRGRPWPVSAKENGEPGSPVERLSEGATVDVNSTLRIELRRDELGSPSGRLVQTDLLARAQGLRESLEGFADLVEAEARATSAWRALGLTSTGSADRATAYERFAAEKRVHAESLERFLGPLRDLWPRDDPEREVVEEVVDAMLSTRAGAGAARVEARQSLGRLLQGKVDRLSADLQRLESEAKTVAATRMLRIEGFVLPAADAEESHPVHVEGYDSLDEKRVETIDRQGLRLTESERRFLLETAQATREIAAALERVRQGEATLAEALAGAKSAYVRELEARVAEIEGLAARAQRTKTAFEAFVREARSLAEAWVREREQAASSSFKTLLSQSQDLAAIASSIEEAKALRERWRAVSGPDGGADLPALVFDTASAADRLATALRRLDLTGLERDLAALFRAELEGASEDVRTRLLAVLSSSGLEAELQGWKDLVVSTRDSLEGLRDLLAGAPPASVPSDLVNPAAFDVPLDMAPDAEIRLQGTTRQAGDRLLVQAKLLERVSDQTKTIESFQTTLRLEKLGWHADLVPTIVIVTADRLAGADDVAGFSASLGWMWSYGPRDDEDDPYLSRSLDWSAGLHAVFLNFGPDNDPEMGLGVSIGLWEDRIQVGAGYNPFADASDEGRFYYYLGSSLLPLLQALSPGE
ncbi:MAG: hypothetical protein ACKVXR_09210 [Planctomycetota bacterium]